MTEAAEFLGKSTIKPHDQDIPSIFTGFDKAKMKSLHKRRKNTLLQKPKQEEQKLLWKMLKQGDLFKARKQTSETTTAWCEIIMHLEKAAELDLPFGDKYRDKYNWLNSPVIYINKKMKRKRR